MVPITHRGLRSGRVGRAPDLLRAMTPEFSKQGPSLSGPQASILGDRLCSICRCRPLYPGLGSSPLPQRAFWPGLLAPRLLRHVSYLLYLLILGGSGAEPVPHPRLCAKGTQASQQAPGA